MLSWLCVFIQIYLTYELLAYSTDGGIEQAKKDSKLEKLVESLAKLTINSTLEDLKINEADGQLPAISGTDHLSYLISLLVIALLTSVDIYQHVLFIAVCAV